MVFKKSFFTKVKILFFVLVLGSWQIPSTNSYFISQAASSNNTFSTTCWANPESVTLTTPVSNSAVSNQDVTFTWTQASSTCPLATFSYNFQIYASSVLVQESGWISNITYTVNNIPEGIYEWKVLAKDQFNSTSTSGTFHLIVDRAVPTATLTITNSPVKLVENRILNNWTTAGDVTVSNGVFQLGRETYTDDVGNYVWENRLMQSFQAGVKNLALDWNFYTKDSGSFDDPGFLIRLNGQEIFATSAASIVNSSGWQHFDYDLSGFPDTTILDLAIYAGNTGSRDNQSWAYVSNISTNTVTASSSATYNVTGTNNCFYKVGSDWIPATNFHLETSNLLNYKCISYSGVSSEEKTTPVKVDSVAPGAIADLFGIETSNSVILTWTATIDAASYDVRYSTTEITSANFGSATQVNKVPAPRDGQTETLEILGLNPETSYWFAIKSADEAPNWSAISNVVPATTLIGESINEGDVVINEIMWSGADRFVELKNMTNRTISLEKMQLGSWAGTLADVISPHGYFVFNLSFPSNIFELELTNDGNLIDVAGDGVKTFPGDETHSMERTSTPGLGSNPLSWYSCLEGNTKGAENRSVNEPVDKSPKLSLSKSGQSASFVVENASNFKESSYELTYDTDTVPQGVAGKGTQAVIVLGTCSTGGTCVYHTGVKNIHLKAELISSDNQKIILEKSYGF